MPNYVIDTLNRLQHNKQHPQYSPHVHLPIIYGKLGQRQYTTSPDTSQLLISQKTTQVKLGLETLLYYARAIDGTTLTAINDIATQQAEPTKHTHK